MFRNEHTKIFGNYTVYKFIMTLIWWIHFIIVDRGFIKEVFHYKYFIKTCFIKTLR